MSQARCIPKLDLRLPTMSRAKILSLLVVTILLAHANCKKVPDIRSGLMQAIAQESGGLVKADVLKVSKGEIKTPEGVSVRPLNPTDYIVEVKLRLDDYEGVYVCPVPIDKSGVPDYSNLKEVVRNLLNRNQLNRGWSAFNKANGQDFDHVNCYWYGRDGTLWIGTSNGIFSLGPRQAQDTWKLLDIEYPRSAMEVNDILIDRANHLWFATNAGLHSCELGANVVRSYYVRDGLSGDVVTLLYEDYERDKTIAVTDGGVCSYDGRRWSRIAIPESLIQNKIQCLYLAHNGCIWMGCLTGLYIYDPRTNTSISTDGTKRLGHTDVRAIEEIPAIGVDNDVCVATSDGAYVFNRSGNVVRRYGRDDGLEDREVNTVSFDIYGNTYFGTSKGLYVRGVSGGWKLFRDAAGLSSGNIRVFFIQNADEGKDYLWFVFNDTRSGIWRYVSWRK